MLREPIGVCGMITPWNWPLNQIACKVGAGAGGRLHHGAEAQRDRALNAIIFAEVMHAAGVPPGVFNLVNGDGPDGGPGARRRIPDVDMVSFTGSTRAGHRGRQGGGRHRQARAPGAGRQVAPTSFWTDADFEQCGKARASWAVQQHGHSPATRRRACWCRRTLEAVAHRQGQRREADHGRRSDAPSEHPARPGGSKVQFNKVQRLIDAGHHGRRTAGHRRSGPARRPERAATTSARRSSPT